MESNETLIRCKFRYSIDEFSEKPIFCLLTNLTYLDKDNPSKKNSGTFLDDSEIVWLFYGKIETPLEFKLCQCHDNDFKIERIETVENPHLFTVPKLSSDQAISIDLKWNSEYEYEIISVEDILSENEELVEKLPINADYINEEFSDKIHDIYNTDIEENLLKSKTNVNNQCKVSPKIKFKVTTESLDSICGSSSEIEEILSHQVNKLGVSITSKNSSSDIPSSSSEKKSSENVSRVNELPEEDEVFSLMETEDGLIDVDIFFLENAASMNNENINTIRSSSMPIQPERSRSHVIMAKIHSLFNFGALRFRNNDNDSQKNDNENKLDLNNSSKIVSLLDEVRREKSSDHIETEEQVFHSNRYKDLFVNKSFTKDSENKELDNIFDNKLISIESQKNDNKSTKDIISDTENTSIFYDFFEKDSQICVEETFGIRNNSIVTNEPSFEEELSKLQNENLSIEKIDEAIIKPKDMYSTIVENEDEIPIGSLNEILDRPISSFLNDYTKDSSLNIPIKSKGGVKSHVEEECLLNKYSESQIIDPNNVVKRENDLEIGGINELNFLENQYEKDYRADSIKSASCSQNNANLNIECEISIEHCSLFEDNEHSKTYHDNCSRLTVKNITELCDEYHSDLETISEELCEEPCSADDHEYESDNPESRKRPLKDFSHQAHMAWEEKDNINEFTEYLDVNMNNENVMNKKNEIHKKSLAKSKKIQKLSNINKLYETVHHTNLASLEPTSKLSRSPEIPISESQTEDNGIVVSANLVNKLTENVETKENRIYKPLIYIGNKNLNYDYDTVNLIDYEFLSSVPSTEDLFSSHQITSKMDFSNEQRSQKFMTENFKINPSSINSIHPNKRNNLQFDAESNDSSLVTSLSKESLEENINNDYSYEKFMDTPAVENSNNTHGNREDDLSIITSQHTFLQAVIEITNNDFNDTTSTDNSTLRCVTVAENANHIDRKENRCCREIESIDIQAHDERNTGENVCSINNDNNKRNGIHLSNNVDVISNSSHSNKSNSLILECQINEQCQLATKISDSLFYDDLLENSRMLNPMLCFFLNENTNQLKLHKQQNEDLLLMHRRQCSNNKLSNETSIGSNQDSAVICDSDLISDSHSVIGTIVQDDSYEEFISRHPMTTSQTVDSLFISALSSNKRTISEETERYSTENSHEVIFDDTQSYFKTVESSLKPVRPIEYCSLPIPPRSGMKRSPALEGVCDLLKKTDSELKLIQQRTYILINDDDLYPDAVTPTKADSTLRLEGSIYDIPYIDDEAFYYDNLFSPFVKSPVRAKLADCDECTLSSTPKFSVKGSVQNLTKQPIVQNVKKKSKIRNRFYRLCGCLSRNRN